MSIDDLTAGFHALPSKWNGADLWLTQVMEVIVHNANCVESEQKKLTNTIHEIGRVKGLIEGNDFALKNDIGMAMKRMKEDCKAALNETLQCVGS